MSKMEEKQIGFFHMKNMISEKKEKILINNSKNLFTQKKII